MFALKLRKILDSSAQVNINGEGSQLDIKILAFTKLLAKSL
jgi:hypothetical protein